MWRCKTSSMGAFYASSFYMQYPEKMVALNTNVEAGVTYGPYHKITEDIAKPNMKMVSLKTNVGARVIYVPYHQIVEDIAKANMKMVALNKNMGASVLYGPYNQITEDIGKIQYLDGSGRQEKTQL